MNISHSCEGWKGVSRGAEKLEMCINGAPVWPRPKPSSLPQPAKARISALKSRNYSLTAATTQPRILELLTQSRLYQDLHVTAAGGSFTSVTICAGV